MQFYTTHMRRLDFLPNSTQRHYPIQYEDDSQDMPRMRLVTGDRYMKWHKEGFKRRADRRSFSVDDSLEDFEELGLSDLAVSVLVDGLDKLVDFLLADLSTLAHVLEGVVDKLGDFVGLEGSAFVLVVGVEHGVHSVSQVLVAITHLQQIFSNYYKKSINYFFPLPKQYPSTFLYTPRTFEFQMGPKPSKQATEQTKVKIEHPRFENARLKQEKRALFMQTAMAVDQRDFERWKKQTSLLPMTPQYLLLAQKSEFSNKGFCGSAGTLDLSYEYYPYLLAEEIQNRKVRRSKFEECELWFLLFSLSAAQTEMKKCFNCKIGDIRPSNIFINQEGQIKISCLYSWPKEQSAFQKSFEHQVTLLAPQEVNRLEMGGMDDISNYKSEMFSLGMTILSAAMLTDFKEIYDIKKFKFRYDEMNDYLNQWRTNTQYSEIFIAFISNLCSYEPQKRLSEKELWNWINKYEEEIQNKEDFVIQQPPLKVEKEFMELRGDSNINLLAEGNHPQTMSTPHMQQFHQERSIVHPFVQGDPRIVSSQAPVIMKQHQPMGFQEPHYINREQLMKAENRPYSPRETEPNLNHQFPHENIQVAESTYTQVPRQQFYHIPSEQPHLMGPGLEHGQMPFQRVMMQNPQCQPQSMIPRQSLEGQNGFIQQPPFKQEGIGEHMIPGQGGNYVYKRRIIDPNSNSVVAEERIQQHEYHRGITNSQSANQEVQNHSQH